VTLTGIETRVDHPIAAIEANVMVMKINFMVLFLYGGGGCSDEVGRMVEEVPIVFTDIYRSSDATR